MSTHRITQLEEQVKAQSELIDVLAKSILKLARASETGFDETKNVVLRLSDRIDEISNDLEKLKKKQ